MDSVTDFCMHHVSFLLDFHISRSTWRRNHSHAWNELVLHARGFARCETSWKILQLSLHVNRRHFLHSVYVDLSVCWRFEWVRKMSQPMCSQWRLNYFIHRDGQNFVNVAFDWRDQPGVALLSSVLLVGISILLHILFNKVHKLRKKLYFYLRLKNALGRVIPW